MGPSEPSLRVNEGVIEIRMSHAPPGIDEAPAGV
jgi:hypothetical protein